jgi:hypothetical protein
MGKFSIQVDKLAKKYEARLRAVARTAVQDTVSMAQEVGVPPNAAMGAVSSGGVLGGSGGRMRVDTGFLRASIQAALQTMPSGPSQNEGTHGGKKKYPVGTQAAGSPVAAVLLTWDPFKPTPLFVGWTAEYARYRESQDGFQRGAAEKWDITVTKAVKKVEAAFG